MLKIAEIFKSIQGEGRNTGMPCVFIRFSGCNKTCSWCDTKHEKYRVYEEEHIVQRLKEQFDCKNVVITGGEPTLQGEGFNKLVTLLSRDGYEICLETNGSMSFDPSKLDWVTVSPKDKKLAISHCDEVKVVWTGKEDLKWYEENIIASFYYLQPCSNINIKETVRKVLNNPTWRLSLQCQKLIDIK